LTASVAGSFGAMLDFNAVRSNIPFRDQIGGMVPLADGLLVYYAIIKYGWTIREFELSLKLFLCGCVLLSVESTAAFFFGIEILPGGSLNRMGMFQSGVLQSYHLIGRLGIIMCFISMYFWIKHHKKMYIVCLGLSSILILSTLGRQGILAPLIGLCLLAIVAIRTGLILQSGKELRKLINLFLYPGVVLMGVLMAMNILGFVAQTRSLQESSILTPLQNRLKLAIRGLDIISKHGIWGGGLGLSPYYLVSAEIPTNISRPMLSFLGMADSYTLRGSIFRYRVDKEDIITPHNLWLQLVLEVGVGGLVFVIFLARKGLVILRGMLSLAKLQLRSYSMGAALVVWFLLFSLMLSVAFTSKFDLYWIFALLFSFLTTLYEEANASVSAPRKGFVIRI